MEESDFECKLPVKGINQFSTHTALAEPELSSECMCKKNRVLLMGAEVSSTVAESML